jgi:hypothetical protein
VDGARDAVGETDVELGQGVLGVDRGLGQVTDGGGLDHVLDRVALDGLVLGGSAGVGLRDWREAVVTRGIRGRGGWVEDTIYGRDVRNISGGWVMDVCEARVRV